MGQNGELSSGLHSLVYSKYSKFCTSHYPLYVTYLFSFTRMQNNKRQSTKNNDNKEKHLRLGLPLDTDHMIILCPHGSQHDMLGINHPPSHFPPRTLRGGFLSKFNCLPCFTIRPVFSPAGYMNSFSPLKVFLKTK